VYILRRCVWRYDFIVCCSIFSSSGLPSIVETTFGNNADFAYLAGSTVATLDPVVYVSAMAAVTKSVSFGITGSTSYLTIRLFFLTPNVR
jgi:hypothetical protein